MSVSRYNGKKAGRLSVDGETFMWRVKHRHTVSTDQYRGCIEILELRRFCAPGRLALIFAPGPGRDVGGYPGASGVIFLNGAGWLNLHERGPRGRSSIMHSRADGIRAALPSRSGTAGLCSRRSPPAAPPPGHDCGSAEGGALAQVTGRLMASGPRAG
ncbi:MAG: hypothetical protein JWM19_6994 [Actinomycetia bacterium]|nr:hypothetical protein [Actinomycetes bacterium]